MKYFLKREDDYWECGDGCCSEYNTCWHVEDEHGKELFVSENSDKEQALMFILQQHDIEVEESWYD